MITAYNVLDLSTISTIIRMNAEDFAPRAFWTYISRYRSGLECRLVCHVFTGECERDHAEIIVKFVHKISVNFGLGVSID